MTDDFRTPPEEVQHLLAEIATVKGSLRDIADKVSKLERHVRRVFRVPATEGRPSRVRQPREPLGPPTLSPAEVLQLFDELAPLLDRDGREAVEGRLSGVGLPDLRLMVQELGAPIPKTPSRSSLMAAILGRVHESRLLSRNRNVSPPRSAGGE